MSTPENKVSRLLSLDVFRGMTIVLMVLVNSPGNNTAYLWLQHSVWNGCKLADLVFPFFIFIVGVSSVISLSKSLKQNVSRYQLILKILRRTIIIFLIGLFLNAFPTHFDLSTIRVFGVLQRIAICYFFASILYLTTKISTQVFIFIGLLIFYWLIMTQIPVPGLLDHDLTLESNLAGYIDRLVFSSSHLYEKIFDPEGLLSTLPAIATCLLGNLTGVWLLTKHSNQVKLQGMVFMGILSLIIGYTWGFAFPINKGLWTSSFVLWTGGIALLLLAVCYWLIEVKKFKGWSLPFSIFGVNALAAYFLHIFFLKIQAIIHMPRTNGAMGNLRIFITEHIFGWLSFQNASLLYAFSYVLIWFVVLGILYRNKIFIKI